MLEARRKSLSEGLVSWRLRSLGPPRRVKVRQKVLKGRAPEWTD